MNTASSRSRNPGGSLFVGLFAIMIWKLAYYATETGYLTWFTAYIAVMTVLAVALGSWLVLRLRASIEQAHLTGATAYASKA